MVASKHCIVPILPLYASLLYNLGYQISADAVRGVCALESSSCDCTRYCNTLRNYARVYVCLISSFDESTLDPRLFFRLIGGVGKKRAWYTLSARAPKFPEIIGIQILS